VHWRAYIYSYECFLCSSFRLPCGGFLESTYKSPLCSPFGRSGTQTCCHLEAQTLWERRIKISPDLQISAIVYGFLGTRSPPSEYDTRPITSSQPYRCRCRQELQYPYTRWRRCTTYMSIIHFCHLASKDVDTAALRFTGKELGDYCEFALPTNRRSCTVLCQTANLLHATVPYPTAVGSRSAQHPKW
jgi:hypothetical protein